MFLIIGCGRSGTSYIATLLRTSKLDIGHENFGKDGVVSWNMAVENGGFKSRVRELNGKENDCEFSKILHQVRHPLKQIRSFLTAELYTPKATWDYISLYTSVNPKQNTTLLNCMKYYYEWNKICETRTAFMYKIEDIDIYYPKICDYLKIIPNYEALKDTKRDINNRPKIGNKLTWELLEKEDKILCNKIFNMSKKYKY